MIHTVRDNIANYVVGLIDQGGSPGFFVYQDAQGNQVAKLTFSRPAFQPSNNGTATANTIISDMNAIGGTINRAVAQDSHGNSIFICTVSFQGGGGDIQLNSTTVAVGQAVSLNSLTYTAPP